MKNFRFLLSLAFAGLYGCGGGSSSPSETQTNEIPPPPAASTNAAPTAVQDNATTSNNAVISINVLANDSDPESDSLTITEIITNPSFGTAAIVNNQIEFIPQQNFAGADSITYRISDGELTSDAEISITMTQSLTLIGSVNDLTSDDMTVAINTGNDDMFILIDDNNEFSIDTVVTDLSQIIKLTASNTNQQPILASLLGNAEQLVQQSGEDRILTPNDLTQLNINQVSTALYLLAEDINENEPIIGAIAFNDIMSSVNAQDILDTAAFIRLIDTSNDFVLEEGLTALSFLDNDELPTTQDFIQQYLTDSELLDLINDPVVEYTNALDQELSNLVSSFTSNKSFEDIINSYIDQPLLVLPSQQPGFIAQSASTYTLKNDGTGTFHLFADDRTEPVSPVPLGWSIESGKLSVVINQQRRQLVPTLVNGSTPDLIAIREIFGEEVAEIFEQFPDLVFRAPMRIDEEQQIFSVLNSVDIGQAQVAVQTILAGELELPDSLRFGENPTFNSVSTLSSANLSNSNESIISDFTLTDIEGEWVLPVVAEIIPFGQDELASRLLKDKFILDSNGTTIGSFTGLEFNWSFENGVITIENQQERYEYKPLRLNGKEYQILLTRIVDEQLSLQQVSTIAQFDESFTIFTDNIITEFPEIYNAHIANTSSDRWIGDMLRASSVFGYNFNSDGTGFAAIVPSLTQGLFIPFRRPNWTLQDNLVTIQTFIGTVFNERKWEVISVDENGRVLVWERRIRIFDDNNNGDLSDETIEDAIVPRINILTLLDLNQYPVILERSEIEQSLLKAVNLENVAASPNIH